ncbi:hypothetical protein D9756_007103 [Leucocoprinus leucothites]|uniref:Uncharacterized protein n=1 Tax=Leucocoprinus leucothites TaxID=201217 RepID=A0A8H5D5R8_9AGAR|nr:hypothetical protein D9756_007103 [Leucoagaricus leucothites]
MGFLFSKPVLPKFEKDDLVFLILASAGSTVPPFEQAVESSGKMFWEAEEYVHDKTHIRVLRKKDMPGLDKSVVLIVPPAFDSQTGLDELKTTGNVRKWLTQIIR